MGNAVQKGQFQFCIFQVLQRYTWVLSDTWELYSVVISYIVLRIFHISSIFKGAHLIYQLFHNNGRAVAIFVIAIQHLRNMFQRPDGIHMARVSTSHVDIRGSTRLDDMASTLNTDLTMVESEDIRSIL